MTLNPNDFGSHGLTGPAHAVQFYEGEGFLYGTVGDFAAAGIRAAEPVVIIATEHHRDGFLAALHARGIDADSLVRGGSLVLADAREMLGTFMDGAIPDGERFRESIGGIIARVGGKRRVRAYGEMVDLLWRDGNPEGAIRLEELWNDLAAYYTFSLLCAYPMGNFYKKSDAALFEEVCRRHGHVVPAESYSGARDEDARSREITLLQQRAEALRTEVEHRKELERALREALAARREAEEQLRDFIEKAPASIHWVGPDGKILWANHAELALLGYAPDEYIGRNIADFHADRHTIEDILARLSAHEEIRDYEARLRAKDGSIRWVSIHSNVRFEDGEFKHTRCFTRDITDRKRLEEERELLLAATTALNRSLDYETRLREIANVAVPRLADWCAVELPREDGTLERVAVSEEESTPHAPEPDTTTRVFRSGEPEVSGSSMVVPMTIGERVLGTITFVAARGYSSADVSLACELARRAATALESARLYRFAQDANRTKDEFLATLSHELRTPLTAILGWARMLTLGGLDAETTHVAFETIERSARTQSALIDDLLDLSRVVTGKLKLQSELVDLATIVTNATQTLQLAANAKGIELEVTGVDERAVVNGDATRLQQIIWNLLTNAIKFSDAGARVTVSVDRTRDAARIVVHDDGRGISADFLPHVFEPFRQADGAHTRKHGGLGLGLAIVKYLSELHGGSVKAASDGEGRGATFTVTLPLASWRLATELEHALPNEITDLRGRTILLVDDDNDTRLLVEAILHRCGADVVSADSVRTACVAIETRMPDVLVTDISMPGEDGYALLEHMRTHNHTRLVPVVALTALGSSEAAEQFRDAGFRAYVRKPIDPLQFARTIADLQ